MFSVCQLSQVSLLFRRKQEDTLEEDACEGDLSTHGPTAVQRETSALRVEYRRGANLFGLSLTFCHRFANNLEVYDLKRLDLGQSTLTFE